MQSRGPGGRKALWKASKKRWNCGDGSEQEIIELDSESALLEADAIQVACLYVRRERGAEDDGVSVTLTRWRGHNHCSRCQGKPAPAEVGLRIREYMRHVTSRKIGLGTCRG